MVMKSPCILMLRKPKPNFSCIPPSAVKTARLLRWPIDNDDKESPLMALPSRLLRYRTLAGHTNLFVLFVTIDSLVINYV